MSRNRASAGTDQEVEWQFDALDLRPVERWIASSGPAAAEATIRPGTTHQQVDVYADTEDWRVYRAGYSLRLRRSRGTWEATLKSLAPAGDGPRRRIEISQPVPNGDPASLADREGPVSERLRAMAGRRPVARAFEVRTRRSTYELSIDGLPVAELALDRTTIPVGDGDEPARLRRVEVELKDGARGVPRFVRELAEAGGLRPATLSKFEAGLLAHGHAPGSALDLGPTDVSAVHSTGEIAYAILRRHLLALVAREPGTRLGEDPEELHDMRVATRRLRAAIALFSPALPVRAASFRQELGWLGQVLGAVRDLDVQLERLGEWEAAAPPSEAAALESLRAGLRESRAAARVELLDALDSRRFDRLVDGMRAMLVRGPSRRLPAARAPILAAGPAVLRPAYRKVRRAGDAIGADSPPAAYHALRIRAKRLRYALEFLEPVYGRPADRLIARLVVLQDLLGLHQDAEVATSRLREMATDPLAPLEPKAVFVMGRIAERYGQHAAQLREGFPKRYRRLRGSAWKDLAHVMRDRRPPGLAWPPPPRTPAATVPDSPEPPEAPEVPESPGPI